MIWMGPKLWVGDERIKPVCLGDSHWSEGNTLRRRNEPKRLADDSNCRVAVRIPLLEEPIRRLVVDMDGSTTENQPKSALKVGGRCVTPTTPRQQQGQALPSPRRMVVFIQRPPAAARVFLDFFVSFTTSVPRYIV